MKNETTVQTGKANEKVKARSIEKTEQTSEQLQPIEITIQAIIEIARAAQKINSLEELSRETVQIGDRKIRLRRSVRSLQQICCDPRRIAALMIHAADNPDWAWVNFWAAFYPEMGMRQMARLRHTNVSTVKYYLDQVELPSDIYDLIPETMEK